MTSCAQNELEAKPLVELDCRQVAQTSTHCFSNQSESKGWLMLPVLGHYTILELAATSTSV